MNVIEMSGDRKVKTVQPEPTQVDELDRLYALFKTLKDDDYSLTVADMFRNLIGASAAMNPAMRGEVDLLKAAFDDAMQAAYARRGMLEVRIGKAE